MIDVRGEKGKGASAPKEADDDLLADATVRIVDVLSEGPIDGFADAENPARCIFFDGVPLETDAGDLNFEGVSWTLHTGDGAAAAPGFSGVEQEIAVGEEVEQESPIERQITDPAIDAARVTVNLPTLTKLEDNGDLVGAAVEYAIEMQLGAAAWQEVARATIEGKTTGGYSRATRVDLPAARPVNLRVRRITADSESTKLQDGLFWASMTLIQDVKLTYPGVARIDIEFPASAFGGRIPARSYLINGVLCQVPENYDPVARTSAGFWSGAFKTAFTDNPAWALYTLITDDHFGVGDLINPQLVDKWAFAQIAAFCDELVDDGEGGQEPRFRLSGPIKDRRAAFNWFAEIAASMNANTYWGAGAVIPVQDRPEQPKMLINQSAVVDGAFEYTKTALAARRSYGVAKWRDPADHYQVSGTAYAEDVEAISLYGYREADELTLPFCPSAGQALRTLRWRIDSGVNQTESVTFVGGWSCAELRPGHVIQVADPARIGWRAAGRIAKIEAARVRIDAPIELSSTELYTLSLTTTEGALTSHQLQGGLSGALEWLPFDQAIDPADYAPGGVWGLNSTQLAPRLFRVLSVKPEDELFSVAAIEYDAAKYARIEEGVKVETAPPYQLPATTPPAAPASLHVEVYHKPRPGARAELRALIGWPRGGDARVARWDVAIEGPGLARELAAQVNSAQADIALTAGAGEYVVYVRAIDALGRGSPWTAHSFTAAGRAAAPDPPANAAIEAGANTLTLLWDYPPEADFDHVEVRASTGGDVEAAQVVGRVDGASLVRAPVAAGQVWNHWLRTVTHAQTDNLSAWAGPFSAAALRVSDVIEPGELELELLAEDVTVPVGQAAADARASADEAAAAASDAEAEAQTAATAQAAAVNARDQAVTAQGGAAASAAAAASSASEAATSSAGAAASESAAVSAKESAEGAAASAETSRGVSVRVSAGPSLLRNPYDPAALADFDVAGGERENLAENTLYGAAGRSVRLTAGAASDLGITALSSVPSHEFESVNAAWLIVEVELELESGSTLSGAGVVADWINQGGVYYRAVAGWADAFDGPRRYTIQRLLQRPANYSGVWGDLRVHLMANWSGFAGDDDLGAKTLRLDRIVIREATAAEIDAGAVPDLSASVVVESAARADAIEGVEAHYVLAVEANDAVSGFRVINAAEPNSGPQSAFIIQADRFSVLPPDRPAAEAAPVFVVDTQTNAAGLNGDLIVDGAINARMLQVAPDIDGLLADGDHLDPTAWALISNADRIAFVRALSNGMGDAPGEGVLRMLAPTPGEYVIAASRRVRVTPGLDYRLDVWARTQSTNAAEATAIAQLRWFALEGDAAHLSISQSTALSGAPDWTRLTVVAQAPPGARWVELWELRVNTGAEWVAFSEARLRPLHTGETIISPGGIQAAQINVAQLAADNGFLDALKVGSAQIEQAAIGSAQIENLSVGSQKIEAGALSSQVFAITDALMELPWDPADANIWDDLQTVAIDVYPGASVYVEGQFMRGGFEHVYQENDDGDVLTVRKIRQTGVRLLRGGVELPYSFTETIQGREVISRIDAPPAGPALYQFQIRRQQRPSNGDVTKITAARRSLSAIQFKK